MFFFSSESWSFTSSSCLFFKSIVFSFRNSCPLSLVILTLFMRQICSFLPSNLNLTLWSFNKANIYHSKSRSINYKMGNSWKVFRVRLQWTIPFFWKSTLPSLIPPVLLIENTMWTRPDLSAWQTSFHFLLHTHVEMWKKKVF